MLSPPIPLISAHSSPSNIYLIVPYHTLQGTRKKDEDALYETADRDDEDDTGDFTAHEKILQGRKRLPIYAYREEFLEAVRDNKIIVVVGETGSGMNEKIRILHICKFRLFVLSFFNLFLFLFHLFIHSFIHLFIYL